MVWPPALRTALACRALESCGCPVLQAGGGVLGWPAALCTRGLAGLHDSWTLDSEAPNLQLPGTHALTGADTCPWPTQKFGVLTRFVLGPPMCFPHPTAGCQCL